MKCRVEKKNSHEILRLNLSRGCPQNVSQSGESKACANNFHLLQRARSETKTSRQDRWTSPILKHVKTADLLIRIISA